MDDPTRQEIAERLRSLHEEAGQPSYGEMQRYLTDELGTALAPTTTTVFRWHQSGVAIHGAPVTQLRVLCLYYSQVLERPITLVDVHPTLAAQWDATRRIAITSRYARLVDPNQQALFDAAA